MTWEDWKASRAKKREALRKYGLESPSRRSVSFASSERIMRQAFGGRRIPVWADAMCGAAL